jgi:nucleoside-diphosphate-sugar epimerase
MSGAEIPIFGDGQQLRDINYVDDVVEALLVAGASESVYGDAFNLGSSAPVSLEDFVRTLIRVAGKGSYRIVPFPADRKAIDIGSVFTDHSKFKTATGWTPRVSLEAGLEQTVRYYAAHRDRYW